MTQPGENGQKDCPYGESDSGFSFTSSPPPNTPLMSTTLQRLHEDIPPEGQPQPRNDPELSTTHSLSTEANPWSPPASYDQSATTYRSLADLHCRIFAGNLGLEHFTEEYWAHLRHLYLASQVDPLYIDYATTIPKTEFIKKVNTVIATQGAAFDQQRINHPEAMRQDWLHGRAILGAWTAMDCVHPEGLVRGIPQTVSPRIPPIVPSVTEDHISTRPDHLVSVAKNVLPDDDQRSLTFYSASSLDNFDTASEGDITASSRPSNLTSENTPVQPPASDTAFSKVAIPPCPQTALLNLQSGTRPEHTRRESLPIPITAEFLDRPPSTDGEDDDYSSNSTDPESFT